MSEGPTKPEEGGIGEALRTAVERTLAATAPAAAQTRDRAGELVDEIAKRGQGARGEIARRGQEAGAEIARRGDEARQELTRRGQGAQAELARQLEGLEQRLASIEELLRKPEGPDRPENEQSNPKAEG